MSEVCGDNRFELIGEFKGKLVDGTNIETSPEEMAVLDNILFRIWQMGWLDKLKAQEPRVMTVNEINQLSNGDTVWVEISDGRLLPMMVEDGTLMRWGYMWRICDEAFCAHEEGECAARAWTSRPTDEQMEAVPWRD